VMLMLLPPLIYYAAFTMSWQAFRANLRPILLLAFGCVIVTTVAVAGAARDHLCGEIRRVTQLAGGIEHPAPVAVCDGPRASVEHPGRGRL